ncbi:hypothetical protein [Rathayibacter sp. AY1E1]|uniref:hypothetical protein n=1 Tax=Rathayibacter sp. AY1E1 TaxID=2080549 RepID=UPI000CE723B1|nr:hypothetical protein [Rathayibacter sp. AY1E1]PPH51193.1 hypothetical protein C5C67_11795 [Rathayibacter sp. AY1E1]
MKINDVDRGELARLWDAIHSLQAQAPIGFSSVSRGALEITSPEGLIVGKPDGEGARQGSQKVYGTLNVVGTLNGDGTIDWEGPVALKGRVDVTGRLHVQGGGRFVASQSGETGQSMQLFYESSTGYLTSFGVPLEIRAWASTVRLNENGLSIEGGGATITMSRDGVQITGPDGGDGAWIELKGKAIYLHNLPSS